MNLLDLIFPPRCPYCNGVITSKSIACEKCILDFPLLPKEKYIASGNVSIAPFVYEGIFKKAILNFKFKNCRYYSKQLAAAVFNAINITYKNVHFDVISYVPLSKQSLSIREYNQSELLAKELSKIIKCPYKPLLLKIKDNKQQHQLPRKMREANVHGVYQIYNSEEVNGKIILLCDDILTTGFTLSECCNVLRQSNALKIYCATVAIVD